MTTLTNEAQHDFQELVASHRRISLILTLLVLAVYFGFILVLAFARDILALNIGAGLTLGLPVGLGVIVFACLVTGLYVRWANTSYDSAVKSITQRMRSN
jgi:uncharacterized membrane protein (DUF485 family)